MYFVTPYAVNGRHFPARRLHRSICDFLPKRMPFVADDEERQLADTIDRIKTQEGPYSPNLLDPFRALALLYRESGNGTFALATIEQALHIVRASYGLRSFEQAPLLREKILLEQDRGNVAEAWQLEQELLNLLSRHPVDLRTVPMLREIADKRIDVLEQLSRWAVSSRDCSRLLL